MFKSVLLSALVFLSSSVFADSTCINICSELYVACFEYCPKLHHGNAHPGCVAQCRAENLRCNQNCYRASLDTEGSSTFSPEVEALVAK